MFTKLVYLKVTNGSRCKLQGISKMLRKSRDGGGVLRTIILKLCALVFSMAIF